MCTVDTLSLGTALRGSRERHPRHFPRSLVLGGEGLRVTGARAIVPYLRACSSVEELWLVAGKGKGTADGKKAAAKLTFPVDPGCVHLGSVTASLFQHTTYALTRARHSRAHGTHARARARR